MRCLKRARIGQFARTFLTPQTRSFWTPAAADAIPLGMAAGDATVHDMWLALARAAAERRVADAGEPLVPGPPDAAAG